MINYPSAGTIQIRFAGRLIISPLSTWLPVVITFILTRIVIIFKQYHQHDLKRQFKYG